MELERHRVTVVVDDFVKKQHTIYITDEEQAHKHKEPEKVSEVVSEVVSNVIDNSRDTRNSVATEVTDHSGGSSKATFSFVASADINSRSSVDINQHDLVTHVDVSIDKSASHHKVSEEAAHYKRETTKHTTEIEVTKVHVNKAPSRTSSHIETPKRQKSVKDHYSKSMGGSTPIVRSAVES